MAKQTYIATQRIRHNGTLYAPGDEMKLTEQEAESLHVSEQTSDGKGETADVSTGMKAEEAIAMIEQTPAAELEGFVPGDEDRVTVQKAWQEKQAESEPEN